MPSLANRASLPARLTPTPVKPIDFARRSVRLSASAVPTSGVGEPAGTATPDRARAMATRLAGSILPARPSIKAGVKTATSNAAPSSICFLHCRRQAETEDKLVAGRLLELRAEFFEDRLHCGGCVDLELCRLRPSREQREDNSDHNRHDTLNLQEALPR